MKSSLVMEQNGSSSSSQLYRYFQAAQSLISLFAVGGLYAMAVFTVPVDELMPGVWATSIGLMHWLSAPVSIMVGLRLDSARTAHSVRPIAVISSLSYSLLALAAYAITIRSKVLLRIAVCFQALPLGINYVLHCETLVRWFPRSPGFIVGCGLLAYNGGTIILCWVFSQIVNGSGIVQALYISALILTLPSLFPALLLSFPPVQFHCSSLSDTHSSYSCNDIVSEEMQLVDGQDPTTSTSSGPLQSVRSMALTKNFWLYVSVILSTGAPYAMLPYFFKFGSVYNLGDSKLMLCFQLVGAVGTALALVSGIIIDLLSTPQHTSGAKRLLLYALVLQLFLFFGLSLGNRNADWAFLGVCILVILTNSHYGCAAVLARDVFGPAKSALAFGVGGGLSIGTGEGLSVQIVAFFEQTARNNTKVGEIFVPQKSTYIPCFVVYIVWTMIGIMSVKKIGVFNTNGQARDGESCSIDFSFETPLACSP